VIALMGLVVDGTARPMLAGIAAVALLTWLLTWISLRGHGSAAPAPASAPDQA
jgi:DHA1 family bicyclomycin/chloramphenicol resistance-like MFS transporter